MKKVKSSLETLSKDSLIDELMLNSIKGGCCSGHGSTYKGTQKQINTGADNQDPGGTGNSSDGIILDTKSD